MGNKTFCGNIFPSGCVLFTGVVPSFINADSLDCDAMLDDVLNLTNDKLQELFDGTNLTDIDAKCFNFTPATGTIKELHQEEIDKICDLRTRLSYLETALGDLNIGSSLITLDLKCLTPQGVPCLQGTNTYSLLSILSIFRDAICDLIENGGGGGTSGTSGCNCTSGTSGNSGTSGANGTSGSSGTSGTTGTSGVAGGVGTISNSNCVTTGRITDVKFNGLSVTASSGSFPVTSGNTFITTANTPSVGTLLVFADGIAGSITVTDSNGVSQCQDYSGAGVYTFTGFAIGSGNWSVLLNCNACVSSSTCNSYTIQANAGGTTLEWEDCTTSAPLSIFVAEYQQYTVCSRIVPLGSYIVVSNNGPCYS